MGRELLSQLKEKDKNVSFKKLQKVEEINQVLEKNVIIMTDLFF